jgi:hypothetical protein
MAADQLSKLSPDGTLLGQSSADKIGFYGLATPIARPNLTAPNTATFTTTMAELHIARIRTVLKNLGLIVTV